MDFQWQKIVHRELEKLKNSRKDLVAEMWNNNRQLQNEKNNSTLCEWKMKDEIGKGELTTISACISRETKNIQTVRAVQLPAVTPMPPMRMWIPIPKNFMVPDAAELSFLPYLGDDNEAWADELIESYDGKLQGDESIMDVMDDYMFADLIKALIPYQCNANEDASITSDSIPKIIFEGILQHFPRTTTADQLHKKYMDLTEKLSECKSNIDDANAKTRGLIPDDSLNTYRKYFCRRCFIYNCQLHGIASNNTKPHRNKQLQLQLEDPCSDTCYKHLMNWVSEEESSENTQERNYNENRSIQDIEWSGSDKTMFLALHEVFPNNSCAIATSMFTKTCQQVYEYFKRAGSKTVNEAVFEKIKRLPKTRTFTLDHASKMYKPCDHEGDCNDKDVNCACINCEKFCNCREDCKKRFRKCSDKQCSSKHCFCYYASRECDRDTCKCGDACKNIAIQQGLHKNVKIAPSDVHGWGLFIQEICEENEFIGEYRGEIISTKEGDRRAKLYQQVGYNYLFQLTEDYDIDGTRFGSDVRFINHSKNPNCESKVKMVNGDHRIGIYANRRIEVGEELLLDYLTLKP